jgi:ribosomal protein S19E (S16A)
VRLEFEHGKNGQEDRYLRRANTRKIPIGGPSTSSAAAVSASYGGVTGATRGRVSSSVLADRLTELREAGIVERADDGYRLSARGAELAEVVLLMARWAAD